MTDNDLNALLTGLGSTPDEIAAALAAADITGQRAEPDSCAVAKYAKSAGYPDVRVGEKNDGSLLVEAGDTEAVIALDTPLHAFVAKFDNGGYPELVRSW